MRILALWLVNYYSGNGDQFFRKSLEKLAHVDVVEIDNSNVNLNLIKAVESGKYDCLIHIPYRDSVRGEIIKHCGKFTKTVCWNGDDEWLWDSKEYHNPRNIAKFYDYNVTTNIFAVPRYQEIGIKPIVAQWGYGVEWSAKKVAKDIDVYFCGASTPERDYYIHPLLKLGLNVVIDGPGYGWSTMKKYKAYKEKRTDGSITGKVPMDVMVERYQHAKIALNFNFGTKDGKAYNQVKARTFEIPATGALQIVSQGDEIDRFFKVGKEIVTFDSREDLINKIKYYVKNSGEREAIALAGHRRNKHYNYVDIFKKVLKRIK